MTSRGQNKLTPDREDRSLITKYFPLRDDLLDGTKPGQIKNLSPSTIGRIKVLHQCQNFFANLWYILGFKITLWNKSFTIAEITYVSYVFGAPANGDVRDSDLKRRGMFLPMAVRTAIFPHTRSRFMRSVMVEYSV